MNRTMLKSKIHRATVTDADLDYEGSISIDPVLARAADFVPFERVEVYNITNGERFSTYIILAEPGSGVISVNGAAAHKANPGDRVIICTYAELAQHEVANFKPKLVYLDEGNHIKRTSDQIPVQVA